MAKDIFSEEYIGQIKISPHILCSCIATIVNEFEGIISIDKESSEKTLDILSRDIATTDGVRITKKDDNVVIDIYVVVEYGVKIPQLAWELQKKIQSEIKDMTGVEVEDINIHIEGVGISSEKIQG